MDTSHISPKLFTSYLQYPIIKINGENKGVKFDGECLSYLVFANDIVLIANSTSKLHRKCSKISMTPASQ